MLIHHYLEFYARNYPSQSCITLNDTSITYAQLELRVNQLANGLHADGIATGDRVAIMGRNSAEHALLFYAASKIGAVAVSLNYRLAVDELYYILQDANVRVLIALDDTLSETLDALRQKLDASVRVFGSSAAEIKDWETWLSQQADTKPLIEASPQDPLLQLYTSGTTGRPKGAVSNHSNLLAQATMNITALAYRARYGDPELVTAPLFHIGGVGGLIISINCGQHMILHQEFNPKAVVDDLHRYGVKGIFMVPAMIAAVLNVPSIESKPFTELEQIYYGAAPISESLLKKAMQVFGADFVQMYGMTETTGTISTLSAEDHKRAISGKPELLRSCGRPSAGAKMKIIDTDGNELPVGEVGEFCIKADCVMMGYYQLPEQTATTLIDGWLHTGDAGYCDDEGYFYLKDRIKDMVVSGGENIYPAEVENILSGHENIQEVAVIGVPCDKYGESLLAILVTIDGKELPVDEMIDYCRGKIAGYKIPRKNKLIDVLPRNPSGKILKTVLREPYWVDVGRNIG